MGKKKEAQDAQGRKCNRMDLRYLDPTSLIPYDKNPRKNDEAAELVASSIEQFDWNQPIVVDKDMVVIVGHTRLKAAIALGYTEVPVVIAGHLSPVRAQAYRLADNKVGEKADWDYGMLTEEIRSLEEQEYDVDELGWDAAEIDDMLTDGISGQVDADELPEPPPAQTEFGQIWQLGKHRLMCGDSLVEEQVNKLMQGEQAQLCATDPPYVVDYDGVRPTAHGRPRGKDWSEKYDETAIEDAGAFFTDTFKQILRVIAPRAAIYVWHDYRRAKLIQSIWEQLDILDHQQIVWVKPTPCFGRVYWHRQHETCMMGWRRGSQPAHSGHEHTSVWELEKPGALENLTKKQLIRLIEEHVDVWRADWEGKAKIVGNEHPTQKPVELFARPMRKHTLRGQLCFEPFSGSGSQIIAGEREGRRVFAMEKSPAFVDLAVLRWENFTGLKGVLVE